jgi:uncharacterized repeat protein (TIGR01451 family)
VSITNSTFTGNQATGTRPNNGSVGLGGAITNSGATSFGLTNVTIVGNHADWVGGGIVGGSAGTSLRNTIVANNTAANGGNPWNIQKNCSSTMGDGGGNLQWPTLNPSDANDRRCAAGVTFADPLLAPLAANGGLTQTMLPLPGSPAFDRGVSCPPPTADQRGIVRPQGPACDIGAVESQAADLSVSATDGGLQPAPGQPVTYLIVVRNLGPAAVPSATVTDVFPASLTGVTWTCAASSGSSCPASGSGNISHTVALPLAGGTVTYTVNATIAPSAARLVANTASVSVPPGAVADSVPGNNAATVVTLLDRDLRFHTVTPCRVADTRSAVAPTGGPALSAGTTRAFRLVGACGIPATAWSVSVNATVTGPIAPGNLRLFPEGTPVPSSSSLNFGAGQTRANSAVVLLGPAGDLSVFDGQATGTTHFLLDVNGYFE